MEENKRKTKKKEKRPRVLLDVSMFPTDDKERPIVPDEFFDENFRALPDGTRNESQTKTAYRGGVLQMLGKDPEHDKEVHKAGGEALQAKLEQRKSFSESLDIALRKQSTKGTGNNLEAITAAMVLKAIDGDVKAAQFIRDTIGEQPIAKQEITADIMTAADRALIEKLQKRIDG